MRNVDKNEAPEGFYAEVSNKSCWGCDFFLKEDGTCRDSILHCLPHLRKDGMSVIFKK